MYIGTVKGVLCLDAEKGTMIWEQKIAGGSDYESWAASFGLTGGDAAPTAT